MADRSGFVSEDDRGLDDREEVRSLFSNLKAALPDLKTLLEECSGHWYYEDPIYRLYHQSWKVYHLQERTQEIVARLQALAPGRKLNEDFTKIVADGTGKEWTNEHDREWLKETRPIVEAFFHARYFLEMAVRYGESLKEPPQRLPSGWAAFLYLYNLR